MSLSPQFSRDWGIVCSNSYTMAAVIHQQIGYHNDYISKLHSRWWMDKIITHIRTMVTDDALCCHHSPTQCASDSLHTRLHCTIMSTWRSDFCCIQISLPIWISHIWYSHHLYANFTTPKAMLQKLNVQTEAEFPHPSEALEAPSHWLYHFKSWSIDKCWGIW